MNKAKYEGLPADLKAALDKHSGMAASEMAGNLWDTRACRSRRWSRAAATPSPCSSEDEKAKWQKATEPVIEAWIKGVKDKGLDGGKLLDTAKGLLAKYEKA